MRIFLITLLAVLCIQFVSAQVPIKQDVLKIVGGIPVPPATAKEAFARVEVDGSPIAPTVSAGKLFAVVESQLKAAEDAYKAQEPAIRAAVPPGMNPEMARMAQDPEFKKKMKSMSKEERMKFAMAMMSGAPTGTPVLKPEPPEIQVACAEWQKLAADMKTEFDRGVDLQNASRAEAMADQQGHAEIQTWEEAALAKLPRISGGEMSAPDPAAVKVVKLRAADKHIVLADKRLAAFAKVWAAEREHVQARYAAFSAKLIAADYAAASPNPSTQKILSDGQMSLMKDVATVAALSRDAYQSAAAWVALKRAIEQQP